MIYFTIIDQLTALSHAYHKSFGHKW